MLSRDGMRSLQVLRNNDTLRVVEAAKHGLDHGPYDVLASGTPVFSADSKHYGFAAARRGTWYFVVDEKSQFPLARRAGGRVVVGGGPAVRLRGRAGEPQAAGDRGGGRGRGGEGRDGG